MADKELCHAVRKHENYQTNAWLLQARADDDLCGQEAIALENEHPTPPQLLAAHPGTPKP